CEIDNARKLMNEVFGEENFIDTIIWKKRYGGGAKEKYLISLHEYVLVYAKNESLLENLYIPLSKESIDRYYKLKDKNFSQRGPYRTHPLEATKSMGERKNLVFSIPAPDGSMVNPQRQWLWGKERVDEALRNDELEFIKGKNGIWSIHTKQYLKEENGDIRQGKPFSIIDDVFTQHGTNEIIDLFGNAQIFSFPKPTKFLNYLINIGLDDGDVILDFFSGSCATAHSVLELNFGERGKRKFIMVQLPEPTDENSEAFKAGYKNIAEIGKDRIRLVIKKIQEELEEEKRKDKEKIQFEPEAERDIDLGFKVFKLDRSNFKIWDGDVEKKPIEEQLQLNIHRIDPNSTEEDLLYEILLKSGFQPTVPVKKIIIEKKTVYSVADDALLICLENELSKEVIKAIAEKQPVRACFLDDGFRGNDQLKTNAVQIMKSHDVKEFRTV
ncbi:MAG: site-specific DNA-methyltransferase, partial [Ignavibacteriae bacterium]|nr:site-specific DNA-methyltransferase [Ignavibacteriota bacterium]